MSRMDPRNIVWPMHPKLDPNGVQRLARVLHWVFVGGAMICVSVGASAGRYDGAAFLVRAVILPVFGRALRYIMAGE